MGGKAVPITLNVRWLDEKDVSPTVRKRLEIHGQILLHEVGKIVSGMIDEAELERKKRKKSGEIVHAK